MADIEKLSSRYKILKDKKTLQLLLVEVTNELNVYIKINWKFNKKYKNMVIEDCIFYSSNTVNMKTDGTFLSCLHRRCNLLCEDMEYRIEKELKQYLASL